MIITDEEVEEALEYLRHSAPLIAVAKAEVTRTGRLIKSTEALAGKLSGEKTAAAQTREALISEDYQKAVQNEFDAIAQYEQLKAYREAAASKIEAWRTASSNYRAMKI